MKVLVLSNDASPVRPPPEVSSSNQNINNTVRVSRHLSASYDYGLIKERNRLISKGTSNIYLKITIEKNWRSQNFNFLSLKNSSPGQLLGSSNSGIYHWILKFLIATPKSEIWEQKYMWFLYYFNFERNYDVLKPKSACFLLNKNINFNKNETVSKIENSTHAFRETSLVLQLL